MRNYIWKMGYFEQAIKWFERSWERYWKQPDWISEFVYCLIQTDSKIRAEEIIKETIREQNHQLDKIRQEVWVRRLAGHSNIVTTSRYLKDSYQDLVDTKIISRGPSTIA